MEIITIVSSTDIKKMFYILVCVFLFPVVRSAGQVEQVAPQSTTLEAPRATREPCGSTPPTKCKGGAKWLHGGHTVTPPFNFASIQNTKSQCVRTL